MTEISAMNDIIAKGFLDTIAKDRPWFLRDHENKVSSLSSLLCFLIDLDANYAEHIRFAAGYHDIGKMIISQEILQNTKEYSGDELLIMQSHTIKGFKIFNEVKHNERMKIAANIALCHHECWDGSGYPFGIAGTQIPLEARIVSLCDVYDSLRENTSYRIGKSHDEAVKIILEGDDKSSPERFAPNLRDVFSKNQEVFAYIYDSFI